MADRILALDTNMLINMFNLGEKSGISGVQALNLFFEMEGGRVLITQNVIKDLQRLDNVPGAREAKNWIFANESTDPKTTKIIRPNFEIPPLDLDDPDNTRNLAEAEINKVMRGGSQVDRYGQTIDLDAELSRFTSDSQRPLFAFATNDFVEQDGWEMVG